MKVQGKLIKRYEPTEQKISSVRSHLLLIGILGAVFICISYAIDSNRSLQRSLDDAGAFIVVLLGVGGVLIILVTIIVGVIISKYNQSYLEIYTDGVILFPGIGEQFEATYDQLQTPQFENNKEVLLTTTFGITGRLPYVDAATGMEICHLIQERINSCRI